MQISSFMIPADKVVYCKPTDSVRKACDLMVERHVGAIVVQNEDENLCPVGIITKTDMVEAYQKALTLDDHTVVDIMHDASQTALTNSMNRDQAAKAMEKNQKHHAIVVNHEGTFVGILSAWDIVSECARDNHTWPWNRAERGGLHKIDEKRPSQMPECPASPKGPLCLQEKTQEGHRSSFLQYIDSLDMVPDM